MPASTTRESRNSPIVQVLVDIGAWMSGSLRTSTTRLVRENTSSPERSQHSFRATRAASPSCRLIDVSGRTRRPPSIGTRRRTSPWSRGLERVSFRCVRGSPARTSRRTSRLPVPGRRAHGRIGARPERVFGQRAGRDGLATDARCRGCAGRASPLIRAARDAGAGRATWRMTRQSPGLGRSTLVTKPRSSRIFGKNPDCRLGSTAGDRVDSHCRLGSTAGNRVDPHCRLGSTAGNLRDLRRRSPSVASVMARTMADDTRSLRSSRPPGWS